MKKLLLISALLTCSLQMSGCASPSSVPPVVARSLELPPPPAGVMIKRQKLSPDQLQRDLLGDTPTTTPSSGN